MWDFPWEAYGLCRQVDPELWFPKEGGSPEPAKRICASCPVMLECRAFSVPRELFGVWGGLTEKERRVLRGRVRPIPLSY